jgi:hypothetical protein
MPARAATLMRAVLVVLATAPGLGGCGEDERAAAPPPPPPPTRPASAVPYLESKERALPAAVVAREAGRPALAARLAEWGYDGGRNRSFQGQSERLQVVDARTYRFRTPAGAAAFMRVIRADPEAFFPGAGEQRALASSGRKGIAVTGLPCSCHMAQPAFFAAVADGTTVSSLEINGARASLGALRRLVAQTP